MDIVKSDILAKADDLAKEIQSSELYKNYRVAVEYINKAPELVEKIAFFRKENIRYRTKLMQNQDTSFEEERYISGLYTELMLIKEGREFLESEKKILDLMAETLNTVSSACEFEFDIFEK